MKKVSISGFVLVLLFALSAMTLFAQNNTTTNATSTPGTTMITTGQSNVDDLGNKNDPLVNQRANACYLVGTLAGYCDTQWEWDCGWGAIRVEYGLIPAALLSQSCQSFRSAPSTYNTFATAIPTGISTSTSGSSTSGSTTSATSLPTSEATSVPTAVPTTGS